MGLTLSVAAAAGASAEHMSVEEIIQKLTPQRGMEGADALPNIAFHLNFELGSSRIRPVSIPLLENLCAAIKLSALSGFTLQIQGHTCDLGDSTYNSRLSRKRADTVRDYLINRCELPSGQFQIKALGETHPLVPNTSEKNRRRNRRVVIINTLKKFESGGQDHRSKAVWLQMTYLRDKRVNVLKNGGVLTSKDGYAIEFRFENSRYVYIGQIDSHGRISAIFPNPDYLSASNPVKANQFFRIPDYGNWFKLDNTVGDETVIVVASRKPLKDPQTVFKMQQKSNRGPENRKDLFVWKRRFVHQHRQKMVKARNKVNGAVLFANGVELFNTAQYDKAVAVLKEVLGMQENHSDARMYLHQCFFEQAVLSDKGGQLTRSLAFMEKSLSDYAKCPPCREDKRKDKIELLNRLALSFARAFQRNLKKIYLDNQIRALELLLIVEPGDRDTQARLNDAEKMSEGFIDQ